MDLARGSLFLQGIGWFIYLFYFLQHDVGWEKKGKFQL